jgi:hypothetical protein
MSCAVASPCWRKLPISWRACGLVTFNLVFSVVRSGPRLPNSVVLHRASQVCFVRICSGWSQCSHRLRNEAPGMIRHGCIAMRQLTGNFLNVV